MVITTIVESNTHAYSNFAGVLKVVHKFHCCVLNIDFWWHFGKYLLSMTFLY